jgi:hypothetical protein
MALVSLTFAAKKPPLTGQKKKAEIEAIDALIAQGQKQLKYNLDSIDVAITSLQEANSRSEEIDYYNGKSKSAYQLGHAYMRLSDNEMATRYFYISKKHAELNKDSSLISGSTMGLGLIMYNINN